MKRLLKEKLNEVKEKVSGSSAKFIITGILGQESISYGEISERLKNAEGGKELRNLLEYSSSLAGLEGVGIMKFFKDLKATKLYKEDEAFATIVNEAYDNINIPDFKKSYPEYILADGVIKAMGKYSSYEEVKRCISTFNSKLDKFKSHRLVADAIFELENDKDADLFDDIIRRLDYSFYLPASHVKEYVFSILKDSYGTHQALADLIRKIRLVNDMAQSKVSYITTKDGRYSLHKRLSPVLKVDEGKVVIVNGHPLKITDAGKIEEVSIPKLPVKYSRLCESFSKFYLTENSLIRQGTLDKFKLNISEGKDMECYRNGEKIKISECDDEEVMTDVEVIDGQKGDVQLLDDVFTVSIGHGAHILDIVLNKDGFYLIVSEVGGVQQEVIPDTDVEAIGQVEDGYGIDIAEAVKDLRRLNEAPENPFGDAAADPAAGGAEDPFAAADPAAGGAEDPLRGGDAGAGNPFGDTGDAGAGAGAPAGMGTTAIDTSQQSKTDVLEETILKYNQELIMINTNIEKIDDLESSLKDDVEVKELYNELLEKKAFFEREIIKLTDEKRKLENPDEASKEEGTEDTGTEEAGGADAGAEGATNPFEGEAPMESLKGDMLKRYCRFTPRKVAGGELVTPILEHEGKTITGMYLLMDGNPQVNRAVCKKVADGNYSVDFKKAGLDPKNVGESMTEIIRIYK